MQNFHPRVIREKSTLEKMISLFCQREHHSQPGVLCDECSELSRYAFDRLNQCPFQEKKSTCAKCSIHCYKPQVRVQIRRVMASAGPHMLLRYPGLTIHHFIDGFRTAPTLPKKDDRQR